MNWKVKTNSKSETRWLLDCLKIIQDAPGRGGCDRDLCGQRGSGGRRRRPAEEPLRGRRVRLWGRGSCRKRRQEDAADQGRYSVMSWDFTCDFATCSLSESDLPLTNSTVGAENKACTNLYLLVLLLLHWPCLPVIYVCKYVPTSIISLLCWSEISLSLCLTNIHKNTMNTTIIKYYIYYKNIFWNLNKKKDCLEISLHHWITTSPKPGSGRTCSAWGRLWTTRTGRSGGTRRGCRTRSTPTRTSRASSPSSTSRAERAPLWKVVIPQF